MYVRNPAAAGSGPHLVLAPLGVGGHVDHVLVRSAAERSGARVVYYSDFPYNQRDPVYNTFIQRKDLVETRWFELAEAKAELVRAYGSQVQALFHDGHIPPVPEVFFSVRAVGTSFVRRRWQSRKGKAQLTTTDIEPGIGRGTSCQAPGGEARRRCRGRWYCDLAHPAGAPRPWF